MEKVWHATEPQSVDKILREGLKPRKECKRFDQFMDKVAEKKGVKARRCESVYAYFPNRCPVSRSAVLSLDVNPEKAYVADMEVATEAGQHFYATDAYANPNKKRESMKRAELFAESYWNDLVTLKEYEKRARKLGFMEPEILIPKGVKPNRIKPSGTCK